MNTIVPVSEDAGDLLVQARDRARKLLEELESRQREFGANSVAEITTQQTEAGREALRNAVHRARRTLNAIEAAIHRRDAPGNSS
jgi:vacuolar-type H+-ATPase subunit H